MSKSLELWQVECVGSATILKVSQSPEQSFMIRNCTAFFLKESFLRDLHLKHWKVLYSDVVGQIGSLSLLVWWKGYVFSQDSVQQLADFRIYLKRDKFLFATLVKRYHLVLNQVFSLAGMDFIDCGIISIRT